VILSLSSSSPVTSIALIDDDDQVLFAETREWKNRALEAFSEMLEELPVPLARVDLFVADLGPGSFTGTRVGVTLAKSLGYAHAKPCAGVTSFDLISTERVVVFPSKRGEWFVRIPGKEITRTELPLEELRKLHPELIGFGPGLEPLTYPTAQNVRSVVRELKPVSAAELLPVYLIEPSISTPKKPIGYTMSNPTVPLSLSGE